MKNKFLNLMEVIRYQYNIVLIEYYFVHTTVIANIIKYNE